MIQEHIVTSFTEDLDHLSNAIIRMGHLTTSQLDSAIKAVMQRDVTLATTVINTDPALDAYEQQIDSEVVRLLAIRQPMAQDLRQILSVYRVAIDLERIGDHAVNIARRSIVISQSQVIQPIKTIPVIAQIVQEMLNDVLDAYVKDNINKAIAVWQRDEVLDDRYMSLFREGLTYMIEDPHTITPCTHLLFVTKNLERIGDHATNIAETLYFQVTGKLLPLERPKGTFLGSPAQNDVKGD